VRVTHTLLKYQGKMHYEQQGKEMNLPIFFANSPESRGDRVNNLLVQCPDGIPFKGNNSLRRSLR